jgi:ribosomal protein S18 acetylase RimI-like enzyme
MDKPFADPSDQPKTTKIELRQGHSGDISFLYEMLYEADWWDESSSGPPIEEWREAPIIRKLLRDWGRRGDTAAIAISATGCPVGAAWYRFWTETENTWAFVDAHIPDVALAVARGQRGQGIGNALLQRLIGMARTNQVRGLSLSVSCANKRAIHLYEKHGFAKLKRKGESWIMLLTLDEEERR